MNCKICNKVFTGIECFKQHEASEKHKKKLFLHNSTSSNTVGVAFNTTARSQNMDITGFPCPTCSKTFPILSDFLEHSGSEEHARMILMKKNTEDKLMENINANSSIDIDSTQGKLENNNLEGKPSWLPRCEKCDKNFSGPEPYQQHVESIAHKKKYHLLPANEVQVEIPSSTSNLLFCEICRLSFCGPVPYQDHMRGKRHLKAISKNRVAENLKENTAPKIMGTIQCETCDKMFTGPICYEQHLKSEGHKKALGQSHYFKILSDKENSPVNSGSDFENSKNQNGFISSLAWYCEVCDIKCSGVDPYREHLTSDRHKKKMMIAGADSKQDELQNLFSNPTSSFVGFPQASGQEGCSGIKRTDISKTSDLGQEVKNYLYGDNSDIKICTPSDLNVTLFAVGEEIDFDKDKKIKIEAKDLDMVEIKEEEIEDMDE